MPCLSVCPRGCRLFGQSYGDKNVDDLHYFKRWGMIVSLLAPP